MAEHTARIVWGASRLGDVVDLPDKARSDFEGVYTYLRRETWSAS